VAVDLLVVSTTDVHGRRLVMNMHKGLMVFFNQQLLAAFKIVNAIKAGSLGLLNSMATEL